LKKIITVKIFAVRKGKEYDGEWPPIEPAGFMDFFARKLEGIPPEYRETAKIEIEHVDECSMSECTYGYTEISVSYQRMEDEGEMIEREAIEERRRIASLRWHDPNDIPWISQK
jgi:hypothetical protein